MENSDFLALILNKARYIMRSNNGKVLAQDHVLVAALQYCTGTASSSSEVLTEPMIAECERMKALLVAVFPDARAAIMRLIDLVVAAQAKSSEYGDGISLHQSIFDAQLLAEKQQLKEIPADLVIQCILRSPTPRIVTAINSSARAGSAAQETPKQPTGGTKRTGGPAVDEDLESILQGIKSSAWQSGQSARVSVSGTQSGESGALENLLGKVKRIQQELLGVIFGQDNAVNTFTTGYFQSEMMAAAGARRNKPGATFLFAGPPGVGKTFLASKAAEALELPFQRFDMSEYCEKESNLEFAGSDKVYKNGKPGNVTDFVAKNPQCVLLFDEIEKAHLTVIHLFLQILDAGRLRDNFTDKEVSFENAILIFTTNAGKQLYEESDSGNFSGVSRKTILRALQQDINPVTDAPYFPAAICSRFGSGNVVMFNRMEAHNLRQIAKQETLAQARQVHQAYGINFDFDERVFSAILFAEGGMADARTTKGRAQSFFNREIYELLSLVNSGGNCGRISKLKKIVFDLELPKYDQKVCELFQPSQNPAVLIFGNVGDPSKLPKELPCRIFTAEDQESALKLMKEQDIQLVLLDLRFGERNKSGYLNIEDEDSAGRDFFRYLRTVQTDMPVYMLERVEAPFSPEECLSLLREGVRDFIRLDSRKPESFIAQLQELSEALHQQQSILTLSKANKVVRFESAQTVSEDGAEARIKLFDFRMEVSVDAEDSEDVINAVSRPNVRFDEVIGAKDAKEELKYFVSYLRNPKRYIGTGVRPPRGVLLYGPPGTGKTMLAKAMATEADCAFIAAEGNQFLKRYVGQGSEAVHALFRRARKYAPAILFIDEIDAIAKERKGGDQGAGSEDTLTAFLAEMDGFKSDPTKPVFVLAATNFDVEPGSDKSLDPAMMRRFDRRVLIDLPDREDREKYLRMKMMTHPALELSEEKIASIALRSTGMSLALLESVIEMALRSAIRAGSTKVTDSVFDDAFETFNSGEVKQWEPSGLLRTARHEAGHAFLCWRGGETPSYVTIVARGNHGGYMQHGDHEKKGSYTRNELLARIRTSLGGRAAEIVYYGLEDGYTTGASGDLRSATGTATRMVCSYGMDPEFGLAAVSPRAQEEGEVSLEVRRIVNRILSQELENAVEEISNHRAAVDALVDALLERNHLTGPEIQHIFESNV